MYYNFRLSLTLYLSLSLSTLSLQSEFLNIYSAYLNEFKVAVKTLAKYEQSSSQFRELLSMCQHSPFCEGLSLASYLLTPVQRLPRYELLLKVPRSHAESHDYHMILYVL